MKYQDYVEIRKQADLEQINWKHLIIKPIISGAMYGVGCYIVSLVLRTQFFKDILDAAKDNLAKKS